MPLIDTPFKRVAIDLIGMINPPSEAGHRYILTLVDYGSRYPEAVPLKKIDSETVAKALVDIFSRVGIPEEILSDQGTQFVSDCMKEVSRLLSIKQLTTTPYHPMCNGLVERFNGTLKSMLKKLCNEKPKQWHRYINALLFAYREVPQESTGFSPFEILYGRTIRGPMQILKELWTKDIDEPETKSSYQYVFELREKLEDTMKIAKEELEKSQGRYKHYYDRKTRPRSLQVGDQVLILLPSEQNKLLMQWKGPYTVKQVISKTDYSVNVNDKPRTYHINLLKKYIPREHQTEEDNALLSIFDVGNVSIMENDHEDQDRDGELPDLYLKNEQSTEAIIGKQLNEEERKVVKNVINNYSDIFSNLPGTTQLIQHKVILTSQDPIRSKPYPTPYSIRESLKSDIQDMLEMGVIRESNSPYASPVVIVKKPDGTNRICVDYRKLNKITIFDPEPMIPPEDIMAKMSKSKYFSKLDFVKGYWQIPVTSDDIPKTAFVTPDGCYEFLKMPFGMMNAGATFVRCMRKLLDGMENIEHYIDDIVVHTETIESHVKTLEELFRRIRRANLTVKFSKCIFASNTVEFVGHNINKGVLSLQEKNVEKIKEAPRPTTKKGVRSFMGLIGFYRSYIPNFSSIAAPLTDLTRKGQPNQVKWGEPQEKAYNNLKALLTSKPILRLPDISKPFVLRTDASDIGLGAVLLQEHEDQLFPVCFASRKLLDRETRYSVMEKECLAIVWAIRKFMMYLYGVEFTLQTDHQPLVYINSCRHINARIMRWSLFLQSYRMRLESIKGKDNLGADFLSRVIT